MNNKITNLVRLAIGIIVLLSVFYVIGFEKIFRTTSSLNLSIIPLVIFFQIFFLLLGAFAMWILLNPISVIKYLDFTKCYILSWAFGLFLPGKLGETSIVYFLKKKNIQIGNGTAIFVIEKILTLMAWSIIFLIGFYYFFPLDVAIKMSFILLVLGFLTFFLILSKTIRGIINRLILKKYPHLFSGFSKTIFHYIKRKKRLLLSAFIFIFLRWIFSGFLFYLILLIGFNTQGDIFEIFMVNGIARFIGLIPISINGLGITQGTQIYLYNLVGISSSVIASTQIILLSLTYILAILGVMIYFKK